jgi:hypothetical protein
VGVAVWLLRSTSTATSALPIFSTKSFSITLRYYVLKH